MGWKYSNKLKKKEKKQAISTQKKNHAAYY